MSMLNVWEEKARIEQGRLQALAEETAIHLGGPWKFQPSQEHGWVAKIINGEAEIWLRATGEREEARRVRVTGAYPGDHLPWQSQRPVITVAMSRGAEVLAKEIRRRFLSKYLALLGSNRENQAIDEEYLRKEQETREILLDLLSGTLYSGYTIRFSGPGDSRGTAEVGGSTVKFELRSVKHREAIWIARLLKKLSKVAKEAKHDDG